MCLIQNHCVNFRSSIREWHDDLRSRDSFIRDYVGFDVAHLSEKDKLEIAATDEFHNMPDYPSEGSIQKINGMWIVKLCEYEE